jgi:hypothetical protein
MTVMTDFLENELIDHIFRARSYAGPTELYIALFTAAPSDAGGGTEVTGGAYARVQLDPLFSNWLGTGGESTAVDSAGTGGATSNNVEILFPAPVGANWGVITHVAIFDESTTDMLFHGPLAAPKTVNDGDAAPKFEVGDLVVALG